MTIFAEGQDFVVRHFPRDAPIHVVWFSNASDGRSRDIDPPVNFLTDLGVGFSLVQQRLTDHWWHTTGFEEAMGILRGAIPNGRRVVAYGFSMGGYGAFRFAGALGAERAVAFGPQDTITPSEAPFETRWAWQAGQIGMVVSPARDAFSKRTEYVVIYDPADVDALHVGRMFEKSDQCRAFHRLPIWFAGHNVATKLHQAGALKTLARGLLMFQNDEVEVALNRYRRHRRREPNAAMRVQALRALSRRGRIAALAKFASQQRDLILASASADELMAAYLALQPHQLLSEALPFVLGATKLRPTVLRYAAHSADCLLGLGRKSEAWELLVPFRDAASGDRWLGILLDRAAA